MSVPIEFSPAVERVPPHALDAEQAVLGCMMLHPDAVDVARCMVKESDFYSDHHRIIYLACVALSDRHDPVDLLTVAGRLAEQELLNGAAGRAYLMACVDATPSWTRCASYCDRVRKMAIRRHLITLFSRGNGLAYDLETDMGDIQALAEEALRTVTHMDTDDGLVPVQRDLARAFDAMTAAKDSGRQIIGRTTGFTGIDAMTGGLQDSDFIIVAGRPAMGKAQPLASPIMTLAGWKRMGEIAVGDRLASVDGQESVVVGVFPQGKKAVYRVTFADGRVVECCGDHLWEVHSCKWEAARVLTTDQVAGFLAKTRYQGRLHVPLHTGDFGRRQDLPLDPYLLGVLLGDGIFQGGTPALCNPDEEIIERVRGIVGPEYVLNSSPNDPDTHRIVRRGGAHMKGVCGVLPNRYATILSSMGLMGMHSYAKFIPPQYLAASREQRLELLRGLLDTDGTAEEYGTIRYCSVSRRLVEGVRELAWSLGAVCRLTEKQGFYRKNGERVDCRTAYILSIRHADPQSLMTLPRKRDRAYARADRPLRLGIVSVEKVREDECQCIMVSHPRGLYLTDGYVVTHNSSFAMNLMENVARYEGKPAAVFSLEMSRLMLAFRMLGGEAKVDSARMRSGRLHESDPDEWQEISRAIARLSDLPVWVDDKADITTGEIRSKLRRFKGEHGLGVVMVDYVQLVGAKQKSDTRHHEITAIARELKAMARELEVPVIALSQLSRQVERRPDKRPMLSDLLESGSLEAEADLVLMLYRDAYYRKKEEGVEVVDDGRGSLPETTEVIIGKNRNGATGMVELTFHRRWSKFKDISNRGETPPPELSSSYDLSMNGAF